MIFSYGERLLFLILAVFFVVHLVTGALIALLTPRILRAAEGWRACGAARLLLLARVAPAGLGFAAVVAICIPSYARFEQDLATERVGWICLAFAILGAATLLAAVWKTLRVSARSLLIFREWRRVARPTLIQDSVVWTTEMDSFGVALAGVFRPRIYLSQQVMEALSADELRAAVRHECAHQKSLDNVKRFLMILFPASPVGAQAFQELERAWERFTEWAADDAAVEGNEERSLSLAAALVKVARFTTNGRVCPLATALVADTEELSRRVDRLLSPQAPTRKPKPWLLAATSVSAATVAVLLFSQPWVHAVCHRAFEHLLSL